MRIKIIGMGLVGRAMVDLFRNHAEVVCFDAATQEDCPADEPAGLCSSPTSHATALTPVT